MAGGQRLISWIHPCSTSKVVLNMCTQHSWATTGPHPNWAGCHTPPLKEPDVLVGPTHPHWANVQERSPLAHARTSRAGVICHVVCPYLGTHAPCAVCSHTNPYAQPRGSALISFVTPHLPNTAQPSPSKGRARLHIAHHLCFRPRFA